MCNWHRNNWRLILVVLTVALAAALIAACGEVSSPDPSISDIDMSETIQRLQQIAPEYQRQLDQMEKLHPDLNTKCSSAYPQKCIPPPPPILKCKDVGLKSFLVLPPDPHNFDPDGNGIGCEG